jgi:hypothetical protein
LFIVLLILASVLFGVLRAARCFAAEDAIAVVIAAEGGVSVSRGGKVLPLALKDPIYLSDTVMTGADGRVQIFFNDDSTVTMTPGTNLEMTAFADEGKSSRFAADLFQGAIRLITGGITEKNPEGFNVTTPLATVGIRGTILYMEADDRHTTVKVLNSDKTVMVNGVSVAESFKITVRLDEEPELEPLASGEADETTAAFIIPAGGAPEASPTEDEPGGDAGNGGMETPETGAENLMDDVTTHLREIRPVTPLTPMVMGNYVEDGFVNRSITATISTWGTPILEFLAGEFASYSFELDLMTGAITNAVTSGKLNGSSPTVNWNLTGGSGDWLTGVSGFSGVGDITGVPLNVSYAKLGPGGSIPAAIGDPVSVVIYLVDTSNQYVEFPLLDGSRVQ